MRAEPTPADYGRVQNWAGPDGRSEEDVGYLAWWAAEERERLAKLLEEHCGVFPAGAAYVDFLRNEGAK